MRVSIITATYNSEQYLDQTIRSVASQTHPDIEHLIIDGGSTDRTLEIVKQWNAPHIRWISEPDEGIYDAFNKGVRMASGDLILILNSDDYLYAPDVIEKVVNGFLHEPELMVVYGNTLQVNERTGFVLRFGKEATLDDFVGGYMIPHPAMFVRKEMFDQCGLFDTRYRIAADYDFAVRCFKQTEGRTRYLDEIITVFRIGGISSNPNNRSLVEREKNDIIIRHFGRDNRRILTSSDLNLPYYQAWISVLLAGTTITAGLKAQGIGKVCIFGSMYAGLMLKKDCERSGIEVLKYLDNSPRRIGLVQDGIEIVAPAWLRSNAAQVDAVLFSFEGPYESEAREQISEILQGGRMPAIHSWKELLASLDVREQRGDTAR